MVVCGTVFSIICSNGYAHDIEDNRAKLVLQEPTHVTLTLYIRYSEILYKVMANGKSYSAFLMACAAMKPDEFNGLHQTAQKILQEKLKVTTNGSGLIPVTGWEWPASTQVQSAMRQQVMAAMVGGGSPAHEPPIEVTANMVQTKEIKKISIRFPAEFGRVLLVWYRPSQAWVEPQQPFDHVQF